VSENAKDFIRKLLNADPNLRMTASQALQHPWIQSVHPDVKTNGLINSLTQEAYVETRKDLLPLLRNNAQSLKDRFKKAVRTMQAVSHWNKILGHPTYSVANIPLPVEETLDSIVAT
jgi:serine/threonine protein kinase